MSAQKTIRIWNEKDTTLIQRWSKLSIFLPKQKTTDISVIICPGGSYYWLDMNNEGFSVAKYLNKQGITAFVLKYRTAMLGNRYPTMIQDLERAMHILKANSKEYGIDSEKIGVMGFSAGGHLAGTAAIYSKTELKPYFAAMIYPVVSMQEGICHKKSRRNLLGKKCSEEMTKMMSLEKNVYSGMPPVFLLHCIGDKKVNYQNSVVLQKALLEMNVMHKFILLDEHKRGGHGFGIKPIGKATGWIDEFLKWLLEIK